ncbi:hypothetical protein AN478_03705 [Thiohalorhabdus denitrificans]|uniref:Ca2+/Na+ antiporter n=1 Tax=Thiohalorhabdus denitrificans TaxID=381306 RepID=A0A0P9ERC6_9GAMM|nr:sodium/calcium exchanger protein [Thiohalorhabdus denitrificans]KPV41041.1 hypothetical protein AN478_03705 [Thiohalorhabdus denitrificans]SCY40644.1 Ca2+/Na+ antiporter [Thiohalorhabdus denitrificans]
MGREPPHQEPPSSRDRAAAGLPEAPSRAERRLRRAGIDPDRLPILHLGLPAGALRPPYPHWARRMVLGVVLWAFLYLGEGLGVALPEWAAAAGALVAGILLLQAACEAFVVGSQRLAARLEWDHYVAGTVAEVLSTLPELVTIAFVVPVSPVAAFTLALVTIYLNTLVFSLYSYFLPKDIHGKFLMPRPITEAGTQVLIAGAAMGLILGLVMLTLNANGHAKDAFAPLDLAVVAVVLLAIFAVYIYKLLAEYAREETEVRETLDLSEAEVERRLDLVYRGVARSPLPVIGWLLLAGIGGAFLGGERVAHFAEVAMADFGFNPLLTALVLAGFAGMSEYVILWQAHRKGEYGIALANAFGGITQVMFLVVPITLLAIAAYQGWVAPDHPTLPLGFDLSNTFLLLFLFPTFFVLLELIEENHTLGILDTTIMTAIVALLILVLIAYGNPV